ncbi:unnamed protein product [Rotaria socialis]|uniref:Death domain-containing protein n=2 Tax=Rotaria socialis TaxID=392032 RepID=A0A818VHM2_9BILA|nr:unnamed protein product [Rotaria socialis]CAF3712358.1 unnamed protein product [Rotaria socialis]CAF4351264.1 unnamed protein product [Rotaria socialis]CAF4623993.1 unnamed protein product [Rotaria socialis]
MMTTTTMLDKPLGDLCHEIADLRQNKTVRDYDMNKLCSIITISRESLKETGKYQQQILNQLQQFDVSLSEINEILRANAQQKIQLEQKQLEQESGDDFDIRAKLMALNAEALECRAAAVQLQQEARMVLTKATEMAKRANDELEQQTLELKARQEQIERNRTAENERRARLEEERQRLKELQQKQLEQQQQQQDERLLAMAKSQAHEDEFANWLVRDFMNDNHYPACIVRTSPDAVSMPINVNYLVVTETENLLDSQEELISTPLNIKFDFITNRQQFILVAIPYIAKRSSHRENVIKVRQSNGIWMSMETNEPTFDSHKDKRFAECKLPESSVCAVVSRLKRDKVLIENQSSGRYLSSSDPRFTFQWPKNVSSNDFSIDICIQPVDLPTFIQFSHDFSHECQGLLAVGPIIELKFDDITLMKPIQFTLPILVQPKKKASSQKTGPASNDESSVPPPLATTSQVPQQQTVAQQQQSIFKSMIGEDSSNERIVLLYSSSNENTWHIDTDIRLADSKTHDIITTDLQYLHCRMIVARYDKQIMAVKQLPTAISLFDQTLNQRCATLFLRRRLANPSEICLVCCSSQRTDSVENEIRQENYSTENEQIKEIVLQEGQLLELRFRGNVVPMDMDQKLIPFAFNTYFPFYFETNVSEIDRYSQHLSSYFYGFIQVFAKQKLRNSIKDADRKKQQSDVVKQDSYETDICLAELLVTLPKPPADMRAPVQKSLTSFTGEGVLTPTLFRDMSTSLNGDEWRRLARRLGMTRIRIEAIEHDYHDDAPYYMLLAWFKRVPRSSDKVILLTHGLMNINRWDLAQELQSIKDDKRSEQGTFSKDDQLKLFRAPFMRICQRDECVRIWKQLARELMLSNEIIQHIEQQYPSKHERCLRSLEHWALNQTRADLPCLARIIRILGFKPLAREIENMA